MFDFKMQAPPSKAETLRALFLAALSDGSCTLFHPLLAEDQQMAIDSLSLMGIAIEKKGSSVVVHGKGGKFSLPGQTLFVANSGVTCRFLTSLAALCPPGKITIDGNQAMRTRPIGELVHALKELGVKISDTHGFCPVQVEGGTLVGGKCTSNGSISSQYISSLLLAAPFAKKDVEIEVSGTLASLPYLKMTLEMMKEFGVEVVHENYRTFKVKHGQRYRAREFKIEGDWSSASYFFASALIGGGKSTLSGLNPRSFQADRVIIDLLEQMGGKVIWGQDGVSIEGTGEILPIQADLHGAPDIVPTLAVTAAFAKGISIFKNVGHLRFKETDRLQAVCNELRKMGIKAWVEGEDLHVQGGNPAKAEIETYDDHRIAMAFSMARLKVPGLKILNPSCVGKSFPEFFTYFNRLLP